MLQYNMGHYFVTVCVLYTWQRFLLWWRTTKVHAFAYTPTSSTKCGSDSHSYVTKLRVLKWYTFLEKTQDTLPYVRRDKNICIYI